MNSSKKQKTDFIFNLNFLSAFLKSHALKKQIFKTNQKKLMKFFPIQIIFAFLIFWIGSNPSSMGSLTSPTQTKVRSKKLQDIPLQMKVPYTGLSESQLSDNNLYFKSKNESSTLQLEVQATDLTSFDFYDPLNPKYSKPRYKKSHFSLYQFHLVSPTIFNTNELEFKIYGGVGYTGTTRSTSLNYQQVEYTSETPLRFTLFQGGLQLDPQYILFKHLEPSFRWGYASALVLAPHSIEQRGLDYNTSGWHYSFLLNKKFRNVGTNFGLHLDFNFQFGFQGLKERSTSQPLSFNGWLLGIQI